MVKNGLFVQVGSVHLPHSRLDSQDDNSGFGVESYLG